jgi:hypothetical protein
VPAGNPVSGTLHSLSQPLLSNVLQMPILGEAAHYVEQRYAPFWGAARSPLLGVCVHFYRYVILYFVEKGGREMQREA